MEKRKEKILLKVEKTKMPAGLSSFALVASQRQGKKIITLRTLRLCGEKTLPTQWVCGLRENHEYNSAT